MTDLTPWLRAWQRAKDTEDEAKEMRLEAEREIIAALGKPDNFKGTAHLEGVSVSFGESVKVDGEALRNIVEHHGLNLEIIDEHIKTLIHISQPTRHTNASRMASSA